MIFSSTAQDSIFPTLDLSLGLDTVSNDTALRGINLLPGGVGTAPPTIEPRAFDALPSFVLADDLLVFKTTNGNDQLHLKVDSDNKLAFSGDLLNFQTLDALTLDSSTTIGIDLGLGDDQLFLDDSLLDALNRTGAKLKLEGGGGNDMLLGANRPTEWWIRGQNSGSLGNIEFTDIENLRGAENFQNYFSFTPGGLLTGTLVGGNTGLDTLAIAGSYENALFTDGGASATTLNLDGNVISFSRIESVIDNTVVANRMLRSTAIGAELFLKADQSAQGNADPASGRTIFSGFSRDSPSLSFLNPSQSLTVDIGIENKLSLNSLGLNANLNINQEKDGSVIFAENFSLAGKNLTVVVDTINVNENVIISLQNPSGNAGNLEFKAKKIELSKQAQILTAKTGNFSDGKITLAVEDVRKRLVSLPFQLDGFSQDVSISLDKGVKIIGGQVSITAQAEDVPSVNSLPSSVNNLFFKPFTQVAGQALNFAIPVSWQLRGATATITMDDTTINASGEVKIKSLVNVDSSVAAISTVNKINPIARLAAAYGQGAGKAETLISGSTTITSTKDVSVTADATIKNNVSARVFGNTGFIGTPVNAKEAGFSIAVANTSLTSKTVVATPVIISSGGNITVEAKGKVDSGAKATTNIFVNGTTGTGLAVNYEHSEVTTEVNGTLTAIGKVGTAKALDPSKIKTGESTLTLENHGFKTNDLIKYNTNGEKAIGGLENGTNYYVLADDDNRFQVSLGQGLELRNDGLSNTAQQSFSRRNGKEFNTSTDIDFSKNQITIRNHGFVTGQQVSYNSLEGNALQTDTQQPLTNDLTYYIIKVDDHSFRLAETADAAREGKAIRLVRSDNPSPISLITYIEAPKTFNPSGEAISNSVITLANHGFTTGDTVVYGVDPTVTTRESLPVFKTFDPNSGVNLSANQIAIPGHGFVTGDRVTYQTSYLGEAATSLGNLSNGTNYFVIRVNDDTVKLATSLENAQANRAIDLTTKGTGALHSLSTIITVEAGDTAIGGLENGNTYYVSVIDQNRFRLTNSEVEAEAAAPIKLDATGTNKQKNQSFANTLTPQNGITIAANLDAKDKVGVTGKTGSNPKIKDIISNLDVAVAAKGFFDFVDYKKNLSAIPGSSKANQFSLGLGVGVNTVDHIVTAKVGSGAILQSQGNVVVDANIKQQTQVSVDTSTGKDEAGASVSVSVGVGNYTNTVDAAIASDAEVDAKGRIDVKATIKYPFLFDVEKTFNFKKTPTEATFNVVEGVKDLFLDGKLGLPDRILNNFVVSRNKGKVDGAKGGIQPDVGLASSVSVTNYNNTTSATIQNGAKINQNPRFQTDTQAVNVEALTGMTLVGAAGIVSFDLNVEGAVKAIKKKDSSEFFSISGNKAKTGIGASVIVSNLNNSTVAKIGDTAKVRTGSGGLSVKSNTDILNIVLAQAGGDAQSFGLSGSGSIFTQTNRTIAQVESGVTVVGGKVDVIAEDTNTVIALVGAVQTADNFGAGVAVGINTISRDTQALIGGGPNAQVSDKNTSITATGNVTVNAVNSGLITSLALAGSVSSSSGPLVKKQQDTAKIIKELETKAKDEELDVSEGERLKNNQKLSEDLQKQSGNGTAIAGDVSVNNINQVTEASIKKNVTLNLGFTRDLAISATDATTIVSAAGAFAFASKPEGNGATGIAGSFAYNGVTSDTKASIVGSTVTVRNLKIAAKTDNLIVGVTGTGASAQGNTSGVAGAGNFSFNLINSQTEAYVTGSRLIVDREADLNANDQATIWAIAGAVGYGNNGGFGVAAAVNLIGTKGDKSDQVRAYIEDSEVSTRINGLKLTATTEGNNKIVAATGSFGVSVNTGPSKGAAIAGLVNVNIIRTEAATYVKNSKITQSDIFNVYSGNTLVLRATDNSVITSIGVAGAVGPNIGIGAAIAYNEIRNKARTFIENAQITITGLQQQATANGQIIAISSGFGLTKGATGIAGAGSLAINNIGNTTESYIAQKSLIKTLGGGMSVSSEDRAKIVSLSGALAGGSKGFGAAVGLNSIKNQSSSYVDNSKISGDRLAINTSSSGSLFSLAAGGALADQFALGGSFTYNSLINQVNAYIANGAEIDVTGNLSITAGESASLTSVAGALAGGLGTGVGAALAYNYIGGTLNFLDVFRPPSTANRNQVNAYIDNAKVSVKGDLSILAGFKAPQDLPVDKTTVATKIIDDTLKSQKVDISGNLTTVTIGGAGASGFALGGAVSSNYVGNSVDARISNIASDKSVTVGRKLSILSQDSSISNLGAGGIGVSPSAGAVGAGIARNEIQNKLSAGIRNTGTGKIQAADLEINANSTAKTRAIAFAGTGAGSFALGGSYVRNQIDNEIIASITDSQNVNTSGSVSLKAVDTSTIAAIAGQVSLGAMVGVGGAAASNEISNKVRAFTDQAKVVTGANLSLEAISNATIEAIAAGVAGGGTVGVAGSIAVNLISNRVESYMDNATVDSNGNVVLLAESINNIKNVSGAIAGSAVVGVGGTVTVNISENQINSYIAGNSKVTANGLSAATTIKKWRDDGKDITETTENIKGLSVAAHSADKVSNISGSLAAAGGVGLGANVLVQTIANETNAYIENSGITTFNLRVQANSNSELSSVSGSAGIGLKGVGVGAVVPILKIANKTKAYIRNFGNGDRPRLIAAGDGEVNALSRERLNTFAGGVGVGAFAGAAGAASVNNIGSITEAYIIQGEVQAQGSFQINAINRTFLDLNTGNLGLGVLIGGGGSATVSTITNVTQAFSQGGSITASAVKINADSQSQVSSNVINLGGGGVAAIAGAVSVLDINRTTKAFITKAFINRPAVITATTGDVDILARDVTKVDNGIGTGSLSLIAGAVGASVDVVTVKNTVDAHIGAGSTVTAQGNVKVAATGSKDVRSNVLSYAFASGGAIRGAVSVINLGTGSDRNSVDAIQPVQSTINNFTSPSGGVMGLNNSDSALAQKIKSRAQNAYFKLSLTEDTSTTDTLAYIGSNANVKTTAGSVTIMAQETIKLKDDQGNPGQQVGGVSGSLLVSAGGSVAVTGIGQSVKAFLDTNATLSAGKDIEVSTKYNSDAASRATGGNASLLVGLGAQVAIVIDRSNHSAFTANDGVNIVKANNFVVKAESDRTINSLGKGQNFGVVAAGASIARSIIGGATTAFIGTNAKIGQTQTVDNVSVMAIDNSRAKSETQPSVVGLLGLEAADINESEINPKITAFVGDNANIKITGDFLVSTTSTADIDAIAEGLNIGVVGGFTIGANRPVATIASEIKAGVGEKVDLTAGSVHVTSRHNIDSDGNIMAKSSRAKASANGGGILAVQGATATAESLVNITTQVGKSTNIASMGSVTVEAKLNNDADAIANSSSLSVAGGGKINATARVQGLSQALIGENVTIKSGADFNLTAVSKKIGGVAADRGAIGIVGEVASAETNLVIEGDTRVITGKSSNITAKNNVNIAARMSTVGDRHSVNSSNGGFATTSSAKGLTSFGHSTLAIIDGNLGANTVNINATVDSLKTTVKSTAKGIAAGSVINSNATNNTQSTTGIFVNASAKLQGRDSLVLSTGHKAVTTNAETLATANIVAIGLANAISEINPTIDSNIVVERGAILATSNLLVNVEAPFDPTFVSSAQRNALFTVSGDRQEKFTRKLNRSINFDGEVDVYPRRVGESALLVVDSAGNITTEEYINATSERDRIDVSVITNKTPRGAVEFKVNPTKIDNTSTTRAEILGAPQFVFKNNFEKITIDNGSDKKLYLGKIDIDRNPRPNISIEISPNANTKDFKPTQTSSNEPTDIYIISPTADVIFKGKITNPSGSTYVNGKVINPSYLPIYAGG